MLKELKIKNLTIIDDLSIIFEEGLNVLTGETGAGKSIIVDAIGLLLGDKAAPDMLKIGEKEAFVEAYFDNTEHRFLKNLSINSEDGILLRRNIYFQGKSRAYINDISVSIQTLANVGRSLMAIHGQHEHQSLLRKENHLSFIDSLGELCENIKSFKSLYHKVLLLKKELVELKNKIHDKNQRAEFLKYQISEINSLTLVSGEKETLEEELNILLNLARLRELSESAYNLLYKSEGSCIEMLSSAISKINDINNIDRNVAELLQMLETAQPLIADSALFLRKFREKYEADPARMDLINERLEAIRRLEKKYKGTVEDIINYSKSAQEELILLDSLDEQTETLQKELMINEELLLKKADELSDMRRLAANELEDRVMLELKQIGFSYADFKVAINKKAVLGENGLDDIEFLFSANPGEPPKPLTKVASGGELSRIMLALKCTEIAKNPLDAVLKFNEGAVTYESELFPKTLIFDEVDAGIGGIAAQNVGSRLKAISADYQVFCITHLPQIAALAENHLAVEKSLSGDTVKLSVKALSGQGRQEEIARMLSGKITDSSLKHARELLGI